MQFTGLLHITSLAYFSGQHRTLSPEVATITVNCTFEYLSFEKKRYAFLQVNLVETLAQWSSIFLDDSSLRQLDNI